MDVVQLGFIIYEQIEALNNTHAHEIYRITSSKVIQYIIKHNLDKKI